MFNIRIMTERRLEEIKHRATMRGQELGKLLALIEYHNRGRIIAGYNVQSQVNEILKEF